MLKIKPYWVKSPKWIRWIFPSYIWHIKTTQKVLHLTFDDGPDPEATPFVLDCLRKYKATATFFCIGECAKKHPKLLQRIKDEGHQIGNHTQHHYNGWNTASHLYAKDILEAEKWLYDSNYKNTFLFRPPYGKCTRKQRTFLKEKEYKIIMWSTLSADFDSNLTKEDVLQNVLKNTTESGSIIIFHDSKKMKEKMRYCLPKILSHYTNKGFVFKHIDASML